MRTVNAEELKSMLDQMKDFVLINVLPEKSFEEEHIPGSHNVPHDDESFTARVASIAAYKTRTIVVYCASRESPASPNAAAKLRDAGFTDVMDFEDGLAGWKSAGYRVYSAAAANR